VNGHLIVVMACGISQNVHYFSDPGKATHGHRPRLDQPPATCYQFPRSAPANKSNQKEYNQPQIDITPPHGVLGKCGCDLERFEVRALYSGELLVCLVEPPLCHAAIS